MKILPHSFYSRKTDTVASELLGKFIVHKTNGYKLVGKIVETEAYFGPGDPASHACNGPTPRSQIMFGPPGRAYVYFCYGNHWLLNFVTEKERKAGAVLIRALEPVRGIEVMRQNRPKVKTNVDLTNGPGKLTQALGIDGSHNGLDITKGNFYVLDSEKKFFKITATTRVGISEGKELPHRYYITGNLFVSRR